MDVFRGCVNFAKALVVMLFTAFSLRYVLSPGFRISLSMAAVELVFFGGLAVLFFFVAKRFWRDRSSFGSWYSFLFYAAAMMLSLTTAIYPFTRLSA